MTLPTSRNRTYSNGSILEPTDLNDLQDFIIAHESAINNASHDSLTVVHPVNSRVAESGTWTVEDNGKLTETGTENTCRVFFVPPPIGSVIESIVVENADTMGSTAALVTIDGDSETEIDSATLSTTEREILSTEHTVVDQRYALKIDSGSTIASGLTVYAFRVHWRRDTP